MELKRISVYFRLLFLFTVDTVRGEFRGSAEIYQLGSATKLLEDLDSSEAKSGGTFSRTMTLEATPELTQSPSSTLNPSESKGIMIVTATRLGTSRYFQSTPSMAPFPASAQTSNASQEIVTSSEFVLSGSEKESDHQSIENESNETSIERNFIQDLPLAGNKVNNGTSFPSVLRQVFSFTPNLVAVVKKAINTINPQPISSESTDVENVNSLETTEASFPPKGTESVTPLDEDQLIEDENEEEEEEFIPEAPDSNSTRTSGETLPSPNALVGLDPPQGLENEYAEALKRQEGGFNPKRRRMRPGLGARRKVRMRVRKGPLTSSSPSTEAEGTEHGITTLEPPRPRRYRSTTTILPTIVKPDPSPPTILPASSDIKPIVTKNGPIFQNNKDVLSPGPQIERPPNQMTTSSFFGPSLATPTPPQARHPDNVTKVEPGDLQSANSKLHVVHADGHTETFGKERDSWEKNYMNLQQNSFYRSSPEVISGEETLRSINKNKGEVKLGEPEPTAPQSEGSQQTIHVVNGENQPHGEPDEPMGEEIGNDHLEIVNNLVLETDHPESILVRQDPQQQFQFPSGNERRGSDEEVIDPGPGRVETENYFRGPPTPPPSDVENYHHPSFGNGAPPPVMSPEGHYDRTRHRVTQLPSGHHSSEQIYESPKPTGEPINNDLRPRPSQYPHNLNGFGDSRRSPTQMNSPIHPFQSHEFLGFGLEKHLNPEKVHKGFLPSAGNDMFRLQNPRQEDKKGEIDFKNPVYQKSYDFFPVPTNQNRISEDHHHPDEKQKVQNPIPPNVFALFPFGTNEHPPPTPPPPIKKVVQDSAPFHPNSPLNPGKTFQQLEKAFYNNLIHSTNPHGGPGGHHFPPAHPRPFFGKDRKSSDTMSSGDASNGHHNFRGGSSPTITLPMPGLVSIPTPPPESHALNQVYSNRHYPPHTHSMSVNPDYVPANPPLLKGHPLQYHFDPFIQNAGDFPAEEPQSHHKSRGNEKSAKFEGHYHGNAPGTFIASQPPSRYNGVEDESSEYVAPPESSRSRKKPPRKRYPKFIEPSTRNKGGGADFSKSSAEEPIKDYRSERHKFGNPAKNLSPAQLHAQHHQEGRRTRGKVFKKSKKEENRNGETPGAFSENAYVLMFSNMVPAGAMVPAKPFINGKHIPVLSASDPAIFEKALAKAASPGFHAAKVHPREQMLQVLASNHYEIEMEKYMEKKKLPPLPIHTPYGLLVPMGLPNSANPQPPPPSNSHHYPDDEEISDSNQHPQTRPHPMTTKPPEIQELTDELMNTFSVDIDDGQVEVINHPPQFIGVVEHDAPYQNHDTSFSEHRPVKASFKGKPIIPNNELNNELKKPGRKTNGELKGLIKSLLREHLEEMLTELETEEKKSVEKVRKGPIVRNKGHLRMKESGSVTSYNFLPPPPPLSQMFKWPSNQKPLPIGPPPLPEQSNGFLNSIRRFFTFGGRKAAESKQSTFPTKNLTRPPGIDGRGSGILKKQSGTMGRETQFIRKGKPISPEELEEDEEGTENWTKEKGGERRRPLEKLLQFLFRKSGNGISPAADPEEKGRPRPPVAKSVSRRPLPFVPSRSAEDLDWTPLHYYPHDNNKRKEPRGRSEEDQIQAETKGDEMGSPPQKSAEEINEIHKNSILDFDAYDSLVKEAKRKYLQEAKNKNRGDENNKKSEGGKFKNIPIMSPNLRKNN